MRSIVAVILLLAAAPGPAQVTARQGTAPPPDIVRFSSPMVLQIPLTDVRQLEVGTQRKLPSLRKYLCDENVSIIALYVEKIATGSRRERGIALSVDGTLFVSDSYDRLVDVGLRLMRNERVYASNTIRSISAEEERAIPFKVLLPVSQAVLDEAFAEGEPKLELTLTVRDNS